MHVIVPFLLTASLVAVAVFLPIKFLGYHAAGRYLCREHPEIPVTAARIATLRVLLGACVDGSVGVIALALMLSSHSLSPGRSMSSGPSISPVIGYLVLMGIRALEWKLIVQKVMLPAYTTRAVNARMLGHVVLGTLWSSFLDLAGVLTIMTLLYVLPALL